MWNVVVVSHHMERWRVELGYRVSGEQGSVCGPVCPEKNVSGESAPCVNAKQGGKLGSGGRVEDVEIERNPIRMMEKKTFSLLIPETSRSSDRFVQSLLNINSLTRRLHVSSGQQRVRVSVLIRKRCEVPDLCSEGGQSGGAWPASRQMRVLSGGLRLLVPQEM